MSGLEVSKTQTRQARGNDQGAMNSSAPMTIGQAINHTFNSRCVSTDRHWKLRHLGISHVECSTERWTVRVLSHINKRWERSLPACKGELRLRLSIAIQSRAHVERLCKSNNTARQVTLIGKFFSISKVNRMDEYVADEKEAADLFDEDCCFLYSSKFPQRIWCR